MRAANGCVEEASGHRLNLQICVYFGDRFVEPFYWVQGTLGNRHDMLSALIMLLDDIRSSGVSH